MLDRQRILAKLDQLRGYLSELEAIIPESFEQYREAAEKRRACERLLHIAIETTIDVCSLIVKGLELGLPAEEAGLFTKLGAKGALTAEMVTTLTSMRGFRNVLVHRYAEVDDELVFEFLETKLGDFKEFERQVLGALKGR